MGPGADPGCNVYAQYLFLTWLPSYLRHVLDVPVADVGLWIAVPYAVAAATCIVVGYASDRLLRVGCPEAVAASRSRRWPASSPQWRQSRSRTRSAGRYCLLPCRFPGIASTTSLNFALLTISSPHRQMSVHVWASSCWLEPVGLTAPIVTGYVVSATGGYTAAFLAAGALQLLGASSALLLSHGAIAAMNAPTAAAPRKVA